MSQLRKIRYRIFSYLPHKLPKPSSEPIDVVIPVIEKDLRILPLCLEGIKKCVLNTIKDIYIVAPHCDNIIQFCKENNLLYVDEVSVLGCSPKDLNLITTDGNNRSGWLFQQFIKLSGNIGTCRYYLTMDADHILLRPHVFLTEDCKTVFYMSYEEHKPYYDEIQRLLPGLQLHKLSYVAHKMLFDKKQLADMLQKISQNHNGKDWRKVILDTIDRNTHAGFSEFETYGNYVKNKVCLPWLQKTLKYSKLAEYETLYDHYASSRWSVTFPEYYSNNK